MSADEPRVFHDLMRPAPGLVRCCICFTPRSADELLVDASDDMAWDICATGPCAAEAGLDADGRRKS